MSSSQIQFKEFLPLLSYVGVSVLGSKLFPGSSLGGRLICAISAGGASLLYSLNRDNSEHTTLRIISEKIALISVATLGTWSTIKLLQAPLKLSFKAAVKLNLAFAATTALIVKATHEPPPIKIPPDDTPQKDPVPIIPKKDPKPVLLQEDPRPMIDLIVPETLDGMADGVFINELLQESFSYLSDKELTKVVQVRRSWLILAKDVMRARIETSLKTTLSDVEKFKKFLRIDFDVKPLPKQIEKMSWKFFNIVYKTHTLMPIPDYTVNKMLGLIKNLRRDDIEEFKFHDDREQKEYGEESAPFHWILANKKSRSHRGLSEDDSLDYGKKSRIPYKAPTILEAITWAYWDCIKFIPNSTAIQPVSSDGECPIKGKNPPSRR